MLRFSPLAISWHCRSVSAPTCAPRPRPAPQQQSSPPSTPLVRPLARAPSSGSLELRLGFGRNVRPAGGAVGSARVVRGCRACAGLLASLPEEHVKVRVSPVCRNFKRRRCSKISFFGIFPGIFGDINKFQGVLRDISSSFQGSRSNKLRWNMPETTKLWNSVVF